jgi:hypothetical protein
MSQLLLEEFNSLTEKQKELHVRESPKEDIISDFYKKFFKCTWSSNNLMKLKQTLISQEEVNYSVSCLPHLLRYTYLRISIPEIRIKENLKENYRIAWTHNLGNNIVVRASFQEGETVFQTYDSYWLDIFPQFFMKNNDFQNHLKSIGSIPELENFSSRLPRKVLSVFQPWYYSYDSALAFPIFYKGKETRAEHNYFFRRKLVDLLRVSVLRDKTWVNLNKDEIAEVLHSIIEMDEEDYSVNKDGMIQIPELWGRYYYLSDAEIKYLMECQKERVYYIRDLISFESDNLLQDGSSFVLDLKNNYPCLAIFWVAENNNAKLLNSYSNYSNSIEGNGTDPINSISFYHGNLAKLENLSIDHFYIGDARITFPSCPKEQGYYAFAIASNVNSYHAESGLVFSKLNSKIKFEFNKNKGSGRTNYNLKVKLLVLKKIKIYKEENGKYEFLID